MTRLAKIIRLAGLGGLVLRLLALPAMAAQPAALPSHLPLHFEANQGQADLPAQFIARGRDYQFLISPAEARIVLRKAGAEPVVVQMQFVGANPLAPVDGGAELPGKINYLTGNDPARWHTGVATFGNVRVTELYPGINLLYYGNQQQLEYDFAVASEANPQAISMHFDGVDTIAINPQGELIISLAGGEIRQPKPVIYQMIGGMRKDIAGGYRLADAHTVAFAIGQYDHHQPLVIDPVLGYSTYFGGTSGETAFAVAVDTNGFVYMTGQTLSSLFATGVPFFTTGVFQTNFAGGKLTGDAFVAKFNNAGRLVYETYLGGSADESGFGIAADAAGNAYLTGFTDSPDFPTTNAIYPTIAGKFSSSFGSYPVDAFVTELNTNGSSLIYSTYLGGSGMESGMGIAVDSSNNTYITGYTYSSNFPVINALQNKLACTNSIFFNANAFVAKIGPGGSPLLYSTYFGGNNFDQGKGIAVDNSNCVYVTGFTASTNFPSPNAVVQQLVWTNVVGTNVTLITNSLKGHFLNSSTNRLNRSFDAFVAKFDSSLGTNLIYSTYLGGTNNDFASGIAVDTNGAAYVTGWTVSTNFPNTAGLYSFVATNTRPDFSTNVFLTKITNGLISSTQQVGIAWSAVFGGKGMDVGNGVAVDPAGANVFVTGSASSTNFPTFKVPGLMSRTNSGKSDAFVIGFSANATDLTGTLYSGYLGGKENDSGYGIALDSLTNVYVVGVTASTNFPNFNGQFDTRNGTNDAFLTKIILNVPIPELDTNAEPITQTNVVGSTVIFSANGTTNDNFPPYFVHWQYGTNLVGGTNLVDATNLVDGGQISGATNLALTLRINNVQLTNQGYYQVVVTNFGGSVTSSIAALGVTNDPARIVVQPVSQTNGLGSTAILSVTATGTAPLSYQWQLNGTNVVNDSHGNHIAGATTNVLTITGVQLTNAGNYTVIVTNVNNAVTSSVAVLTIQTVPIITVQPISQTNQVGSTMILTTTNIGTVPLHFQWQFGTDQVNWSNLANGGSLPGAIISGANFNTLTITNAQVTNSGFYQLTVTNISGSVTSSIAILALTNVLPVVSVQPTNQLVGVGTKASLAAIATGTAPLHYQWLFNGTNLVNGGQITGATNATLNINAATTNNTGSYTVIVTNAAGSVTSSPAILTVQAAPVFTVQPISQTNVVGTTIILTATNVGTVPLHYQWQYGTNLVTWKNLVNGGLISGATTNTLSITNAQTTNSGFYQLAVTNIAGAVTSSIVTLLITNAPPAISTQPTNQTVVVGSNVTMAVIATGTPPLHYQWLLNGTNLVNETHGGHISGATTSTLKIDNAAITNSGNYTVIITNLGGSVTSSNAFLTVTEAPVITDQPTNRAVAVGSTATLAVKAVGTPSLSFQWQFNGTDLVTWTNLVNGGQISGATNAGLFISNAQLTNGSNYRVIITNRFGSATSSIVVLTVTNIPTAVIRPPTNQTVAVGSTVTNVVIAAGTGPLSYQWQTNGTDLVDGGNISGALTNVLILRNVQTNDSGAYSVTITGPGGSVTTNAVLTVTNVPPTIVTQPTNQLVVLGTTATNVVIANGTPPLSYQWQVNGTNLVDGGNISGATTNVLILSNMQTNNNGGYSVTITGPGGSVTSSTGLVKVVSSPEIIVQPTDLAVKVGSLATLAVTVEGAPPLSYQWQLNGTDLVNWTNLVNGGQISGATTSVLSISNAQVANTSNYRVVITNSFGSLISSNALLTVTNVPPAIILQPINQIVVLGTKATNAVVAIGTAPLSYQWQMNGTNLVNGGNISGATSNVLILSNIQTNDGGGYSVTVTGPGGFVTSSTGVLTVASSPLITVQPTDRSVAVGSPVTLVVAAVGVSPLSYQWQFNGTDLINWTNLVNGGQISGATNSVLFISNAQVTNTSNYRVVITNSFGSVTSSNALLTVTNIPPAIIQQPTNQVVAAGSAVTNVVIATGTAPLSFQWQMNGTNLVNGGNISGATNNILILGNAQTNDSGGYSVTVTGPGGSVASSNAILTVASSPIILVQPTNLSLAVGSTATLVVTAVGIAPLSYQWLLDDTNLVDGATNNILTIPNAQTTNSGNYSVTITNSAGSVTSSNAILTITNIATVLSLQPSNQTVNVGGTATFSVSGTAQKPFVLQWLKDGTNLVNGGRIDGATNAMLVITNVQTIDAGTYWIVVTSPWGLLASSNAILTVIASSPSFGQVAIANGGSFILSGSGGLSNGTYYVLLSSNLQAGSWTPVATNLFDSSGNFIFTNTADTNAPQLFFMLQLP